MPPDEAARLDPIAGLVDIPPLAVDKGNFRIVGEGLGHGVKSAREIKVVGV